MENRKVIRCEEKERKMGRKGKKGGNKMRRKGKQ